MKNEDIGEFYFIIPRNDSGMVSDMAALRLVNEIHKGKGIDEVILRYSENYPAVERYCRENKKAPIGINKIDDQVELLEERILHRETNKFRRWVYISGSENIDNLEEIGKKLSDKNFYVEARITGF